ncbi:MAG: hypothetical protein ACRC2G_10480 [Aestuariivirga sp.]
MTTSQHAAVRLLAQRILEIGYEDLPARERHVIERVANRLAVSRDINVDYDEGLTFGQRLSDRIAAFGGSWSFIMIFGAAIATWVMVKSSYTRAAAAASTPTPSSCSISFSR